MIASMLGQEGGRRQGRIQESMHPLSITLGLINGSQLAQSVLTKMFCCWQVNALFCFWVLPPQENQVCCFVYFTSVRCHTCNYISPLTEIQGPKCSFTIPDHFNLVYCISCRRCPLLYICETGRSLRSRFSERLRSIRNNSPSFPMAQHFNSTGHSISGYF